MNKKIKHKEWVEGVLRERGGKKSRYGFLRLEKNERLTPFSDDFWKKVLKNIRQEHIMAYPETERFYDRLSKLHGYKADHFVLTAGSDAAIRNAFDLCVKPGDAVVTLKPTFAMVEVYCELYNAEKRLISYNGDLSLNIEALLNSIDRKVSLIILANPNSPTGTYIDNAAIEKIVMRAGEFQAAALIDEAYHGFCGKTSLPLIKRFKNLMVTRSFSKAPGLAGLRIGYIIACPDLASLLYKFRPMYEVNSVALLFAGAVLDNWDEVTSYIEETNAGKAYLMKELSRLNFFYIDTYANFIHVDFKRKRELAKELFEEKGVGVRSGLDLPGFENFLRITLGPKPAMKKFVRILETL